MRILVSFLIVQDVICGDHVKSSSAPLLWVILAVFRPKGQRACDAKVAAGSPLAGSNAVTRFGPTRGCRYCRGSLAVRERVFYTYNLLAVITAASAVAMVCSRILPHFPPLIVPKYNIDSK